MDQDIIQQLFDAGLVDKSVLDKVVGSPPTEDGSPSVVDELAASAANEGSDFSSLVEKVKPYLIHQESRGRDDAVSPKGARGRMQVMPETAMETAKKMGMKKYDLFDKEQNEAIGSRYLNDQLERFDGDVELALAAYNGGPNRVQKLLDKTGGSSFDDIARLLPAETRDYVKKINANAMKTEGVSLKDLSGKGTTPPPIMAKNQESPGLLSQVGEMILPSAQAEEPAAAPEGEAPLPEMPQDPSALPPPAAPVDPMQAQALQQAQQSAQAGDPSATLGALDLGQQVSPSNQKLQQAFNLQQAGEMGKAQAEAAGAQSAEQAYKDAALQIAQTGVDYTAKRQKAEAATQQDLERFRKKVIDFSSASIDPNRLFKSQSTWSTVLLGLSGALQAASGDTAAGLKIVNDAINRDIDIQKANVDIKKQDINNEISLMGANHQQLGSINAAEDQTRAQMLAFADATVKQLAMNTKSEVAQQNLLSISGQLKQQQIELEQKFEAQRLKNNALKGLEEKPITDGLSPAQVRLANVAAISPQHQLRLVTDLQGNPAALASNPRAQKAVTEAILKKEEINGYINSLREMYAKYGNPTFLGSQANYDSLNKTYSMLKQAAVVANVSSGGLGRYVRLETSLADSMFPPGIISDGFFGGAKNSIKRTLFKDDFLNILDQAEKLYNGKLLGVIDQQTDAATRTPEFKAWLAEQRAMVGGGDPDMKEVK